MANSFSPHSALSPDALSASSLAWPDWRIAEVAIELSGRERHRFTVNAHGSLLRRRRLGDSPDDCGRSVTFYASDYGLKGFPIGR